MPLDLNQLGDRVRQARIARGMTAKTLAASSGVSLRFLSELENGRGNISVRRLGDIAGVLDIELPSLLSSPVKPTVAAQHALAQRILALPPRGFRDLESRLESLLDLSERPADVIALMGVRGAGKSTVGARVAQALEIPFVELDALIEEEAGLMLGEIFAFHGEQYYREIEARVLRRFLDTHGHAVLATGGSLVRHDVAWRLLQRSAVTVWLRASATTLWERVVAQGDLRPMDSNPNAFAQLEALVEEREPLYAEADLAIETTGSSLGSVVSAVVSAAREGRGGPGCF